MNWGVKEGTGNIRARMMWRNIHKQWNKLTNFVVARNVNYHYYFIALRKVEEEKEKKETKLCEISRTTLNCGMKYYEKIFLSQFFITIFYHKDLMD